MYQVSRFPKSSMFTTSVTLFKSSLLFLSWSRTLRFLAHLTQRVMWAIAITFRPSVNISHFNLLLRKYWANCNQTLVEWSFDGPLPKLCPVIPTSNHSMWLALLLWENVQQRHCSDWIFTMPCIRNTLNNYIINQLYHR